MGAKKSVCRQHRTRLVFETWFPHFLRSLNFDRVGHALFSKERVSFEKKGHSFEKNVRSFENNACSFQKNARSFQKNMHSFQKNEHSLRSFLVS